MYDLTNYRRGKMEEGVSGDPPPVYRIKEGKDLGV